MIGRRVFLRTMALAGGLVVTLPASLAWAKKLAFNVAKAEKLREVGGWAVLELKGKLLLFVRDSPTTVKALDATCTHQQCTVKYDHQQGKVVCPCHGSRFELDGTVLNGPATRSLATHPASLQGDRVVLELGE